MTFDKQIELAYAADKTSARMRLCDNPNLINSILMDGVIFCKYEVAIKMCNNVFSRNERKKEVAH